uniref:hypothetical protein n=1 Tax=Flavobacterium sp. TaxID=239 RepID=UPI0040487BD6
MKKFLTCVLFFFISQLYSQNIGYSLNVDHLFLADEIKSSNDDNNPKLYEDITAGDFLHERLVELGLIKK